MSIRTPQWPVPRPCYLRALIAGITLGLPLSAVAEAEAQPEPKAELSSAASPRPSPRPSPSEQPSAEDSAAPDGGDGDADAGTAEERLGVELNKLEPIDSGCRVYLVFENELGTNLEALQLELFLFDTEGFIKRHLKLDAAPIDEDKTSVKLFDLAEIQCERVGRILINDVTAMAGPDGALSNGISRLDLSSKLDVDLFK